jgi:hypothetical protein
MLPDRALGAEDHAPHGHLYLARFRGNERFFIANGLLVKCGPSDTAAGLSNVLSPTSTSCE